MEVATDEAGTPIRQDLTKDGRLRSYASPMPWMALEPFWPM